MENTTTSPEVVTIDPLVKLACAGGADAVLKAHNITGDHRVKLASHFAAGTAQRVQRRQRIASALLTYAQTAK